MGTIPEFETLAYEETEDGVAWVTLDRPDALNSFNRRMQAELEVLWRALRARDEVRCIVLTGAGEKAFCTGIDRMEQMGEGAPTLEPGEEGYIGSVGTPFQFDDPGDHIGPKTNGLWKPVIAAVNGMACGGAFYLLGEVEFVIAADHATFFDPHVTYGMTAAYEPLHLSASVPFNELMRISLLGNHERMSADRAHQIGFVSEVAPAGELRQRAAWAAGAIASAPALAIQGTVRALWSARAAQRQAVDGAWSYIGLGTNQESLAEGQAAFASGKRITHRTR
jgi:enoyl-CoA hydratase/carnithine racemase